MVVFSEHWRFDRYGLNMLNQRESCKTTPSMGREGWQMRSGSLDWEHGKTIQLQFFWKTSWQTSQHTFWCSSLTSKLQLTKLKITIKHPQYVCKQVYIYIIYTFTNFKTMHFCKGSFGEYSTEKLMSFDLLHRGFKILGGPKDVQSGPPMILINGVKWGLYKPL